MHLRNYGEVGSSRVQGREPPASSDKPSLALPWQAEPTCDLWKVMGLKAGVGYGWCRLGPWVDSELGADSATYLLPSSFPSLKHRGRTDKYAHHGEKPRGTRLMDLEVWGTTPAQHDLPNYHGTTGPREDDFLDATSRWQQDLP
ncbi:hypothetical protein IAQ61_002619, partial [Plenodomus lingam]|uniref:Predicted protein n=1 Tax=Leptosphaeria maculans (strain JN3 / isolate v23.1.3 / race Av1-4-5-6-7-8) TaxID=985895 RepID=E4ZI19_LEPMJ